MANDTRRTIVCATDMSEASRCALDRAIELSATFGVAWLHVLYIQERPERIESVTGVVEHDVAREHELQREVYEEIARLSAARGSSPSVESVIKIRSGKAYREIVSYAVEVNADIIVVGTHGRTGLGHAVLGSVAERIARHAPCDVLVVKSPAVRTRLAEVLGLSLSPGASDPSR